jgi:hypothetical protein
MNIYDLFELLIRKAGLAEPIERDALELIEELRRANAFGTVAGRSEVADHQPVHGWWNSKVCQLCSKEH